MRLMIRVVAALVVMFGALVYVLFNMVMEIVSAYPIESGVVGGVVAVLALAGTIAAIVQQNRQRARWEELTRDEFGHLQQ